MFYNVQQQEEADFEVSSEASADQFGATYNAPSTQAWVLSDRDAWYPNPAYQGPVVPHPEDDSQYYED